LRDLDSKIWELGQIWENFLEMIIAHNPSVAGAINSKMRARGSVARMGGGVVSMWSCSLCEASNRGTLRNCRQCNTIRVERGARHRTAFQPPRPGVMYDTERPVPATPPPCTPPGAAAMVDLTSPASESPASDCFEQASEHAVLAACDAETYAEPDALEAAAAYTIPAPRSVSQASRGQQRSSPRKTGGASARKPSPNGKKASKKKQAANTVCVTPSPRAVRPVVPSPTVGGVLSVGA
jgi:hypothetical protein